MQENPRERHRNYFILALTGCLLVLVMLMFLGTAILTGIYLYDRYGLPSLSVDQSLLQIETPTSSDQEPLQLAPAATLSSPVVEGEFWSTPTIIPTPTLWTPNTGEYAAAPPNLDQHPVPADAYAYLERLYLADHPEHDYFNLAKYLGRQDLGARTVPRPTFAKGDRQIFKTPGGEIEATLMAVTEHAYFWAEDALQIPQESYEQAAQELETRYYSSTNLLFGQPWAPGIDGDPRFSILHMRGEGSRYELGFFSDQDEYPQTLFQDSNEQELVYLIMDQLEVGSPLYFGTLVHELQHLFQWNLDKNEATWFNEGLSQLAELYVQLDTVVPEPYLEQPAVRLDRWSYEEPLIGAHYGASFLFLVYCWDQLSEAGIYELVRHPANGLVAVRSVLQGLQPDRSLEEFLADWAVATFIDDPFAGEEYYYARLDLSQPALKAQVQQVPYNVSHELDQLAVHYIGIDQAGQYEVNFAGDTTARLIDAPPTSGEEFWYALPSNDTDAQLTAPFDLSLLDRATLTFNAWYDLEDGFDFAYISVSEDNGSTWNILRPQHGVPGDYGPALTGRSSDATDAVNGWVKETLSLNEYVGKQILLRFQVLTDFKTTGRGLAIDDIAIGELGYFDDVEQGTGQWAANGFARTGWLLPQQWAVRLIQHGSPSHVSPLLPNALNQIQQTITLGPEGGTLVIMPLTPFVDETALYWLQID